MNRPALVFALIAAASAVGYASYIQVPEPGADIRIAKTDREPLRKPIQSRICPFDATEFTGCDR